MPITINADSVEELKYLAGLLNKSEPQKPEMPMATDPIIEPEMPDNSVSSCGTDTGSMGDLLSKLKDIEGRDPKLVGEEWANSTEYFDGEEREMEQPKGEIVDTSLRRYLKAKGDHVTVDEGTHTIDSMFESYKKFKK
jgi:hypothetical protein